MKTEGRGAMQMRIARMLCVTSILCAPNNCGSGALTIAQEPKEYVKVDAPLIALTHVRVIDGTGASAREDQTIIIANGKIRSVAPAAETELPDAARVVDLKGYTVIPG